MDLKESITSLGNKIEKYKEKLINEEMTKTALILPFFDILGYDTRNPFEFHPEFTADIPGSKGEKVDYAIIKDDIPLILIEAKTFNDNLDKHDGQLIRYFNVTKAKIGILTNGKIYKFYTDLDEQNKMDEKPFLEIDISTIKEHEINELKKFYKTNFNIDNIMTTAEELKYSNSIKKFLRNEFENPSEIFSNFILSQIYEGIKTQKLKDKFMSIVKKSVIEFSNDLVRNKLENALEPKINNEVEEIVDVLTKENNIITTSEEIEGFSIVKAILLETIDLDRITYKDSTSYLAISLDDNIRKWVCRLYFNSANKYISFPEINENGERTRNEKKFPLPKGINSLFDFKEELCKIIKLHN